MVEGIAIALICGYIIYKLEKIDRRQDEIELKVGVLQAKLDLMFDSGGG